MNELQENKIRQEIEDLWQIQKRIIQSQAEIMTKFNIVNVAFKDQTEEQEKRIVQLEKKITLIQNEKFITTQGSG